VLGDHPAMVTGGLLSRPHTRRWPSIATTNNIPHTAVVRGGPAYRAGIHTGDVLVSLNGRATLSQVAFDSVLASLKPKQTDKATVVGQDSQRRAVTIHRGELPVSAS
jgi:S1-C subfamily serine protease